MNNYEIIKDEKELRRFIDWLPDLKYNEAYYFSLLARNKYSKEIVHINSDREQLRLFTTTKEKMYNAILQLECPIGAYRQKDKVMPQEALALYMHPNPRDLKRAGVNALKRFADLVTRDAYSLYHPEREAMTEVHKARGSKYFVDFDFDSLDYEYFRDEVLNKTINPEACSIVDTRGGFHVLIRPDRVSEEFKTTWYNGLSVLIEETDKAIGDILLPVPGCVQGGFAPWFITRDGVIQ